MKCAASIDMMPNNGYDCYESFQYGWENGERVRYDTTFCYDDHDRRYEPQGVRATVRIH